jgi:hypothetical protein
MRDVVHRERLIRLIRSQSVVFDPIKHNTSPVVVINWCKERLGLMRPRHPLFEAYDGWIDYFDGDWACTWNAPGYDASIWWFWFHNENDMVEFKLCWL